MAWCGFRLTAMPTSDFMMKGRWRDRRGFLPVGFFLSCAELFSGSLCQGLLAKKLCETRETLFVLLPSDPNPATSRNGSPVPSLIAGF